MPRPLDPRLGFYHLSSDVSDFTHIIVVISEIVFNISQIAFVISPFSQLGILSFILSHVSCHRAAVMFVISKFSVSMS